MSGPVSTVDVPDARTAPQPAPGPCLELSESREAEVGGLTVRRALPRRGRRTVGAWCFVDHLGPAALTGQTQVQVGPHPHMGLQTVTWLLSGEQVHRDSLGSEQLIRPGELNLMSAGHGVAHAEESEGYRGEAHGAQLWVAQPESTRHGEAAFEHLSALPRVELEAVDATVLVGAFGPERSPARTDTPLVGLELAARPGSGLLPLDRSFEYCLVVLAGALAVGDQVVRPGHLGYLGAGRDELPVEARDPTRALLLGGEPFESPIFMWWNFVARSREEVETAHRDWTDRTGRFGEVASPLARIPAPPPSWTRPGG